jgi:hypothetical protein
MGRYLEKFVFLSCAFCRKGKGNNDDECVHPNNTNEHQLERARSFNTPEGIMSTHLSM